MQKKERGESFARGRRAREVDGPWLGNLAHCSAGYEDGQPKVASVKLSPEYIVSRKGRWAVASRQTGAAKKKIKIIITLIDQLYSRED